MSQTTNRAGLTGPAGLTVALFDLAVKDARRGNGHALEARAFLASPWAARLLAGLNDTLGTEYSPAELRAIVGDLATYDVQS